MPATGTGFLPLGRGVDAKIGHNISNHLKGKWPDFFAISTGCESGFLYLYWVSHHLMDYPDDVKVIVAQKLKMNEMYVPQDAVFIENVYLQPAGTAW